MRRRILQALGAGAAVLAVSSTAACTAVFRGPDFASGSQNRAAQLEAIDQYDSAVETETGLAFENPDTNLGPCGPAVAVRDSGGEGELTSPEGAGRKSLQALIKKGEAYSTDDSAVQQKAIVKGAEVLQDLFPEPEDPDTVNTVMACISPKLSKAAAQLVTLNIPDINMPHTTNNAQGVAVLVGKTITLN